MIRKEANTYKYLLPIIFNPVLKSPASKSFFFKNDFMIH